MLLMVPVMGCKFTTWPQQGHFSAAKNQMKLDNKDIAKVYAYFSSHVTQSEEHYFITLLKLVAQLGGYFGLFRTSLVLLEMCHFSRLRQDDRLKHVVESRRSRRNGTEEAPEADPTMMLSSFAIENT